MKFLPFIKATPSKIKQSAKYGKRIWNITVWIVTIYTALYGIAFQRYENRVNRLYNIFSAYIDRLGTENNEQTLQGLINLQSERIPYEPIYWYPQSLFRTFFQEIEYDLLVQDISSILENLLINNFSATDKNVIEFKNINMADGDVLINNPIVNRIRIDSSIFNSLNSDSISSYLHLNYSVINELNFNRSVISIVDSPKSMKKLSSDYSVIHIDDEIEFEIMDCKNTLINSNMYLGHSLQTKTNKVKGNNCVFANINFDVDSIEVTDGKFHPLIFYKCNFSSIPSFVEKTVKWVDTNYAPIKFYKCNIKGELVSNIDSVHVFDEVKKILDIPKIIITNKDILSVEYNSPEDYLLDYHSSFVIDYYGGIKFDLNYDITRHMEFDTTKEYSLKQLLNAGNKVQNVDAR
jgi:hypothetical protein